MVSRVTEGKFHGTFDCLTIEVGLLSPCINGVRILKKKRT